MIKLSLMSEGLIPEGLKGTEETQVSQNMRDFYKLYYHPKNSYQSKRNSISFRAKSVNAILQANTQEIQVPSHLLVRQKKSLIERIRSHEKQKKQLKLEKFSYKDLLAKQTKTQSIEKYFGQYQKNLNVDLQEYSKGSIGVKLAIQKCKDEKMKIKKVISSNRQSEQTKSDYLQLKKKDIEDDIKKEIKTIYQQFFKKQYEASNTKGYEQFQPKIRKAMELMHRQIFGN